MKNSLNTRCKILVVAMSFFVMLFSVAYRSPDIFVIENLLQDKITISGVI